MIKGTRDGSVSFKTTFRVDLTCVYFVDHWCSSLIALSTLPLSAPKSQLSFPLSLSLSGQLIRFLILIRILFNQIAHSLLLMLMMRRRERERGLRILSLCLSHLLKVVFNYYSYSLSLASSPSNRSTGGSRSIFFYFLQQCSFTCIYIFAFSPPSQCTRLQLIWIARQRSLPLTQQSELITSQGIMLRTYISLVKQAHWSSFFFSFSCHSEKVHRATCTPRSLKNKQQQQKWQRARRLKQR